MIYRVKDNFVRRIVREEIVDLLVRAVSWIILFGLILLAFCGFLAVFFPQETHAQEIGFVEQVSGNSSNSSATSGFIDIDSGNLIVADFSGADSVSCTPFGGISASISDNLGLSWTNFESYYANGRTCGASWYHVATTSLTGLTVTGSFTGGLFAENSHINVSEWHATSTDSGGGSATSTLMTSAEYVQIVRDFSILWLLVFALCVFLVLRFL